MRELPGVTLLCVDTLNQALALRALALSGAALQFAETLFLTDAIPRGAAVPAGISVRRIDKLGSRDDYSRFILKSLLAHVTTPHVLLIQWDGYVINPDSFDPAFLDRDYIGAKWFWFDDGMRVGNGGFSLRSRKLLQALPANRSRRGGGCHDRPRVPAAARARLRHPLCRRCDGGPLRIRSRVPDREAIRLSRPLQLLPRRRSG